MAEQGKKESIIGKIVGEVAAKGLSWVLGPLIGISIGLGIGFVLIDGIINSIRQKLWEAVPFFDARSIIPEFHLLDWYLDVLRAVVLNTLGKAIAALWLPALVVLAIWLVWRFLQWTPVENQPKIWQRIMGALFRGAYAGGTRAAGFTGRKAREGGTAAKTKWQAWRAARAARRAARPVLNPADAAALDEAGEVEIEEDLGALDIEEDVPVPGPVFPPPPETLTEDKRPRVKIPLFGMLVIGKKK